MFQKFLECWLKKNEISLKIQIIENYNSFMPKFSCSRKKQPSIMRKKSDFIAKKLYLAHTMGEVSKDSLEKVDKFLPKQF